MNAEGCEKSDHRTAKPGASDLVECGRNLELASESEIQTVPIDILPITVLYSRCSLETDSPNTEENMATKPKRIDEQLRTAIKASGLTRYRIAKNAGITQIMLDRFVTEEGDLRLATAAKICTALNLELTTKG